MDAVTRNAIGELAARWRARAAERKKQVEHDVDGWCCINELERCADEADQLLRAFVAVPPEVAAIFAVCPCRARHPALDRAAHICTCECHVRPSQPAFVDRPITAYDLALEAERTKYNGPIKPGAACMKCNDGRIYLMHTDGTAIICPYCRANPAAVLAGG